MGESPESQTKTPSTPRHGGQGSNGEKTLNFKNSMCLI